MRHLLNLLFRHMSLGESSGPFEIRGLVPFRIPHRRGTWPVPVPPNRRVVLALQPRGPF
jgi:hypothetical protein